MFHVKKYLLAGFFTAITAISFSQGSYSYKPGEFNVQLKTDTAITRLLTTDVLYTSLSDFERDMVYAVNYVRRHPKLFKEQAVDVYLKLYPQLLPKYGESLQKELAMATDIGQLQMDGRLIKLARAHAKDLAANNVMSHSSSNGQSFQQRFEKEGITCGSECINGGKAVSALEALLSLLIDYNVSNFGHRRSLLNSANTSVGVGTAFGSSDKQMRYTVLDLGCF